MSGRCRSKSITLISQGLEDDMYEHNDVITEETSSQGSSADEDVQIDAGVCK